MTIVHGSSGPAVPASGGPVRPDSTPQPPAQQSNKQPQRQQPPPPTSTDPTRSTNDAASSVASSTTPGTRARGLKRKRRWGQRTVEAFKKVEKIGEGTYGEVWRAIDKESGEEVALKRILMDKEKEGFPITAIREIRLLRNLNHKNIVNLTEIVMSEPKPDKNQHKRPCADIYMVFEYLEHDLVGLTDQPRFRGFTIPQVKYYVYQLLQGIEYCHSNKVLHRDLKGSNLLLNNNGDLKVADFGLARPLERGKDRAYTNLVITLWYRPPELLLGARKYGAEVDMWSVGCIIAELLLHKPLLPADTEAAQLQKIYQICGTPTTAESAAGSATYWPSVSDSKLYPLWSTLRPPIPKPRRLREVLHKLPSDAQDLIEKLLILDPKRRLTAAQACEHKWFWTPDFLGGNKFDTSTLPKYQSMHEYQSKMKRQARQEKREQKHQQQQQPSQNGNGNGPHRQGASNSGHHHRPHNSGQGHNNNNNNRGGHGGPPGQQKQQHRPPPPANNQPERPPAEASSTVPTGPPAFKY